ncbi:MAG TPA: tetratricopeptide repeat protein [Pyrinomonadaceae bacterium]
MTQPYCRRDFLKRREPTFWIWLEVLLLAALLANVAVAQVGGGHLVFGDFKVTEAKNGEPTPQVFNVVLYSRFGSVVARQSVTNHGRFQFYNVSNGEYDIVVEVESQEVARTHIVLTSSLRSDFRYDISLEWRESGTTKKPASVSAEDLYHRVQPNKGWYDKAEEAFESKKYDQAASLFQQIVANDPADFQAWSELGTLYLAEKKTKEADAAYVRALEARPKFFLALMNLGKLRLATGNADGAIQPLTDAVTVKPNSADANYFLGEAYLQVKKGSKAVGYLNAAATLGRPDAHLRLATLYDAAKLKDRAAAEYEQFLQKRPDYPDRKKLEKYIAENGKK